MGKGSRAPFPFIMPAYKNQCFTNDQDAFKVMASDCPPVTSEGHALSCSPTSTGYTVSRFDGTTTNTYSVNPTLPECFIDIETSAELSGLIMLVLITAFMFQQYKRPIR